MMSYMMKKGQKALAAEYKIYMDYKMAVLGMSKKLELDMKNSNSEIDDLVVQISMADQTVEQLVNDIKKLEAEIAEQEKVKAEKLDVRAKQHEQYAKQRLDAQESVDALDRAIQSLKSRNGVVADESMLQKMMDGDPKMRHLLAGFSFLQSESEPRYVIDPTEIEPEVNAPAAAAYKFQSAEIVEMLEQLYDKFHNQLQELMTLETQQARASELEIADLQNAIDALNRELQTDTVAKGEKTQESAEANADMTRIKAEVADMQKTYSDMKATYTLKTDTYKENTNVREKELKAIQEAIDIISGMTVNRGYHKHISKHLDKVGISFLQVNSAQSVTLTSNVVSLLRQRAKELSSHTLAALAARINNAPNPFLKVIDMIEDLLVKLKDQRAAEADHKEWCDTQLDKNAKKRQRLETTVNELKANIEANEAKEERLKKTIATLLADQKQLVEDMRRITLQRNVDEANNKATATDAEKGKMATEQALTILTEFYAGKSFLQRGQQRGKSSQQQGQPVDTPEMAEYTGMEENKDSIIGMVEVIATDFARLLTETLAAEKQSKDQYSQDMLDMRLLKDKKQDDQMAFENELDETQFELKQDRKNLRANTKDFDNAKLYFEDLKSSCVEIKVSFEERVQKREEEIAALREAYNMLDSKRGQFLR